MVGGQPVAGELLGELRDSTALLGATDDGRGLRARFVHDGYVLLRQVLDRDAVLAARAAVLARLEQVDEIEPDTDGIPTGRSTRDALHADRGDFWRSVTATAALRAVSHGPAIHAVMRTLVGAEVQALDYLMLRVGVRGRATDVHYDYPFFSRFHDQTRTVWMPIGDTPLERGPLFVVEGGNRFDDLIEPMIGFDVATDTSRSAAFHATGTDLARQRGTRLLSTDFRAGDVLVFGMFTAHGSLEQHDPHGRVRVSCDGRWQPAALPVDQRYMGEAPAGTTGAGYGELNGAKPLTEPWHVR